MTVPFRKSRLFTLVVILLACVVNSFGEEPVAEFPMVKMKNDTIAMIVRKDIEPTLTNYYKDKPKILIADGYGNKLNFENLSTALRISDKSLNGIIGYITVGEVYVLIDRSLLKYIDSSYVHKRRFDMIEVYKLYEPGIVTIIMSDPWEWSYTINKRNIIGSRSFSPGVHIL